MGDCCGETGRIPLLDRPNCTAVHYSSRGVLFRRCVLTSIFHASINSLKGVLSWKKRKCRRCSIPSVAISMSMRFLKN
jgi:hypothetical protein